MNKTYALLLCLLCLSAGHLYAQFTDLSAPFPPPSEDIGWMSVPSAGVIWATGYASTANQSFVRSADNGQTWTGDVLPTPTTMWDNTSIIALDANTAWVTLIDRETGTLGAIYKTTNGGASWVRQGADSLFLDVELSFANWTYFWDANVGVTMGDAIDGYFEIWRTTDGGDSWSRVPAANLPPPVDAGDYGLSDAYAAIGDTVWCTTRRGTVLRSIDRGLTWQGFATGHTGYYKIYFRDAAHGLSVRRSASSAPNAFRTTSDGGTTWSAPFTPTVSDSTLGLTNAPFFMRHADYVPGTSILVGVGRETNSLLELAAVSYDDGHTFTALGVAPGDFSYVQMVSSTSGYLGGVENEVAKVYQLDAALSAVREPLAATVPARVLGNPVGNQLTIEVLEDLGARGALTLFDIQGRQLCRMPAPFSFAGQQLQMSLGDLPAGLYMLKISADQGVASLKVVVR